MRAILIIGLVIICGIGCKKDKDDPNTLDGPESPANPINPGPRLSYGDTLFSLSNLPTNSVLPPVSKPNVAGYFKSIPKGLTIDTVTGNINISQSETGIRYKIYYLSNNGMPIDSVKLVISGIDYKDGIYELAATPIAYDTVFPIYNARPDLALPCGGDDDDDDSSNCIFDETDLDNDGNDDIPGVIQSKLLVDIKKGTIDAEASFRAGVFGSSTPGNGISQDFTFYYRLKDASNMTLNKITVRLYHFNKVSDIPQKLLDTLAERNEMILAVNSVANNAMTTEYTMNSNSNHNQLTSLTSFTNNRLEFAVKPKRPPIIIIVSQ